MPIELRSADELLAVLERGADVDDGEVVDVLAHSLQTAALLEERHPDDGELQLAGLVHDVGWILEPDDADAHPAVGARAVRPVLGERIAWLVGGHVVAKRYLVTDDPAYRATLSPRSIETLEQQGGLLSDAARAKLDADPVRRDALLELRRADDDAKVPGLAVPSLGAWAERLLTFTVR